MFNAPRSIAASIARLSWYLLLTTLCAAPLAALAAPTEPASTTLSATAAVSSDPTATPESAAVATTPTAAAAAENSFSVFLPMVGQSATSTSTSTGSGGTYYLTPGGASSSCGTQSKPCRAPQYLPGLKAGALVLAAAGRYSDWEINGRRGSSSAPIFVRSQSGKRDVVVGSNIAVKNSSFVVVDGVVADGGSIRIDDSADVTVQNARAQNSLSFGVRIRRAPRLTLSKIEVDSSGSNCIDGYVDTSSGYRGDPIAFSQGVVIDSVSLQNCGANGIYILTMNPIIRNSLIRNIGVIKQDPRVHGIYTKADNALIENNRVETAVHNGITTRNTAVIRNNYVRDVGLSKGPSSLYGGSCYRFYNDGPQNGGSIVFENNICAGGGPQFAGGLAIDGTSTNGAGYTILARNNSFYGARSAAISISNFSKGRVSLQHNILVKSDGGRAISGSAGTQLNGTNLTRESAGEARDLFVNAPGGDLHLVKAQTGLAAVLDVTWSLDLHSVALSDVLLVSAAPSDKDGNQRGTPPGLGALN